MHLKTLPLGSARPSTHSVPHKTAAISAGFTRTWGCRSITCSAARWETAHSGSGFQLLACTAAVTMATTASLLLGAPCSSLATVLPQADIAEAPLLLQPGGSRHSTDEKSDALLTLMLKAADALSRNAGNLLLLNTPEAKAEELQGQQVVDVALRMSEDALTLAQEAGELAALESVPEPERQLAYQIYEAAKLVSSIAHDLAMTEQISAGVQNW